jgi:hypothetical protein
MVLLACDDDAFYLSLAETTMMAREPNGSETQIVVPTN